MTQLNHSTWVISTVGLSALTRLAQTASLRQLMSELAHAPRADALSASHRDALEEALASGRAAARQRGSGWSSQELDALKALGLGPGARHVLVVCDTFLGVQAALMTKAALRSHGHPAELLYVQGLGPAPLSQDAARALRARLEDRVQLARAARQRIIFALTGGVAGVNALMRTWAEALADDVLGEPRDLPDWPPRDHKIS